MREPHGRADEETADGVAEGAALTDGVMPPTMVGTASAADVAVTRSGARGGRGVIGQLASCTGTEALPYPTPPVGPAAALLLVAAPLDGRRAGLFLFAASLLHGLLRC